MATDREQKLVNIAFECVAMVTDKQFAAHFQKMPLPERMAWVAKQLRECGFPTHPVGASWGNLD